MKRLVSAIKNNFITSLCFFLSAAMLFSAVAVTYAKYLESETANEQGAVGAASFSATIDGISALSFTNTAFWGGTAGDDKVAMNALRSIDFSINNFDIVNGVEQVNSVKSNYELTFTAPANFVEKLAIQVVDSANKAVIPQIVISEILHGSDFNTANSEDYSATAATDVQFSVSESDGVYTAESDGITVKLTPTVKRLEQTIYFRLWDTSKLTTGSMTTVENEGGDLLSPVCITINQDVVCYTISVNLPEKFVLPASEPTTHNYVMRLAPTNTLVDDHLGGLLMVKEGDNSYTVTETLYSGQQLHVITTDENVVENAAVQPSDPDDEKWYTVIGNAKTYEQGNTVTVNLEPSVILDGPVLTPGTPNDVISKTYDVKYYRNGTYLGERTGLTSIPTDRYGNSNSTRATSREITTYYTVVTTQIDTTTSKVTKTTATENITTTNISVTDGITKIEQSVEKESEITTIDSVSKTTTVTTSTYYTTRTDSYGTGWISGTESDKQNEQITNIDSSSTDPQETTATTTPAPETFYRTVFRRQVDVGIKFEKVYRTFTRAELDENNNPITVTETVEYGSDSPLNIFETDANGVYRQVYFVSQCYSKSFPLSVNVKFEQIN